MTITEKKKRYCFVGGGTAGSLMPLLALAQIVRIREKESDTRFIVSRKPADSYIIHHEGFLCTPIPSGKFRRYFDLRNVSDMILIVWAFVRSLVLLRHWKPDIVVSAGSFVAVPVSWAAWVLHIPVVIHQQDVQQGFANRLMEPIASLVTVTFASSLRHFRKARSVLVTGNPVRRETFLADPERARRALGLRHDLPIVLVVGGSSGAEFLNALIANARPYLERICSLVHILGRNTKHVPEETPWYHPIGFVESHISDLLAAADVVVARSGLSTITELAVLGRPTILIPIPRTHQEANAHLLDKQRAAIFLEQKKLSVEKFVQTIQDLLNNRQRRFALSRSIQTFARRDAADKILNALNGIMHEVSAS